ncbi:MAG: LacI family DNA-binding transcriptional regulator, partial [Angelakisella sp.]
MKKQINAKDVAREAGVSSATVSYVLNSPANITISAQTREKVLDAVQKLGYVPNQAAKTLGTGRTSGNLQSNLIGVVIPQTEPGKEFMFSNPFYADFLSAVEYTARANGYQLLITGTNVN